MVSYVCGVIRLSAALTIYYECFVCTSVCVVPVRVCVLVL